MNRILKAEIFYLFNPITLEVSTGILEKQLALFNLLYKLHFLGGSSKNGVYTINFTQ